MPKVGEHVMIDTMPNETIIVEKVLGVRGGVKIYNSTKDIHDLLVITNGFWQLNNYHKDHLVNFDHWKSSVHPCLENPCSENSYQEIRLTLGAQDFECQSLEPVGILRHNKPPKRDPTKVSFNREGEVRKYSPRKSPPKEVGTLNSSYVKI
jgi:hypothetical protein